MGRTDAEAMCQALHRMRYLDRHIGSEKLGMSMNGPGDRPGPLFIGSSGSKMASSLLVLRTSRRSGEATSLTQTSELNTHDPRQSAKSTMPASS
jgi:hypothetical protein